MQKRINRDENTHSTSQEHVQGGLFTCMCEHGVAYASFIIKTAEVPNKPPSFLTCYLRKAPEVVIYKFACSLMDCCLNRAPDFFKFTLFLVGRFHWKNHIACAQSFDIIRYSGYKRIEEMITNS